MIIFVDWVVLMTEIGWLSFSTGGFVRENNTEAYSAAGRIHSCQQTTNRKEYVICLAFPYF